MTTDRAPRRPLTRRAVVRGALSAAGLSAAGVLTACGGGDEDPTDQPTVTPTMAPASPTTTPVLNATPLAAYQDPERWRGRTLTVATPGGAYQSAQDQAYVQPFQEATGARLSLEVVDLARLRQQVERGETVWDV